MIKRKKGVRRRKSAVSLKIARDNRLNKRKYSKRYLMLRNRILLRDGFTCQCRLCESPKGVRLQVHHIVKHSTNKALRNNKFNLISICNKCAVDHINGREKRFEAYFKIQARRNEAKFKDVKLTKEQILAELKKDQILPEGFQQYQYKTDVEINKVKTEEYYLRKTWRLIKFRTQNKTSNAYKNYGGRGITMYGPWIADFKEFDKYVKENLGDRPEGASIDRIDNDKNYEPGNIRWATADLQGQNRRTNVLDEVTVSVILILYYKYKLKIKDILDKLNLPSRSSINGVVKGKTWANISKEYVNIITDQEVVDKITSWRPSVVNRTKAKK